MTYAEWFSELQETAMKVFGFSRSFAKSLDPDAWRVYYDEGLTPSQALSEDLSYI